MRGRMQLALIKLNPMTHTERKMPENKPRNVVRRGLLLACILLVPGLVVAAEPTAKDVGNSLWLAWLGICGALVFFMQAGFALLECGMSRAKNTVNIIMKNFCDMATSTLGFWAVGFGLMFGMNQSGWIGASDFAMQSNDGAAMMNFFYQLMFAATCSTIVSGAVAERMRFSAYLIGAFIITLVIYPVYGAWTWNDDGWLAKLGFIDAAGSSVVHAVGGWVALGAVLALGPRLGRFSRKGEVRDIPGHNLPMFALGAFILWFGWMGFNGGSANRDFSDLAKILINTTLGPAAAVVGALVAMKLSGSPILMTRTINGALGGLVAITAGCKTMDPAFALVAGFVAGMLVPLAESWLLKMQIDDVVGAIPVHGACGVWGTLAAGAFYSGDLFSVERILVQFIGAVAAMIWALPMGYIMFKAIDMAVGLRVNAQDEQRGLDYAEHFEAGYSDITTSHVPPGPHASPTRDPA
jgi:Amt family ammonium transporter